MNNLKSFNESILTQDQLSDLNDICLELKDIGYRVFILQRDRGLYVVKIYKTQRIVKRLGNIYYYNWDEIKDTVERIMDYVELQGFSFRCETNQDRSYAQIYEIWISN